VKGEKKNKKKKQKNKKKKTQNAKKRAPPSGSRELPNRVLSHCGAEHPGKQYLDG
jgi:ribosomal protein L32